MIARSINWKLISVTDEPVRCNSSLWEENAVDPSSSQQSSAGSEHDTSSGDESNKYVRCGGFFYTYSLHYTYVWYLLC